MLKLNEFSHNHHPSNMKMLAKHSRRGISDNENGGNLCLQSMFTFLTL
jgi:hypothetical protein